MFLVAEGLNTQGHSGNRPSAPQQSAFREATRDLEASEDKLTHFTVGLPALSCALCLNSWASSRMAAETQEMGRGSCQFLEPCTQDWQVSLPPYSTGQVVTEARPQGKDTAPALDGRHVKKR